MTDYTNDSVIARWLGDAPGSPPRDELLEALDSLYLRRFPSRAAQRTARDRLRRALAGLTPRVVWYDSIRGTSVGRVFFATSPAGLVAVDFGMSERVFRAHLQTRLSARAARAPGRLAEIGGQLRDYLAGRRTSFDLPLDLQALPEFQRRVLLAALKIPRGQVATYGEIARRVGRPKASRAVGQALGHNPMPIVIPCHRVLGADGSLRGYGSGGGIKTKARLLDLEGARSSRPARR